MDYMQEREAPSAGLRNGGTLAQANQAVRPREPGRISMHLEARQKLQSMLEHAINEMEQRLNPVLQQNPAAPTQGSDAKRPLSGLADVMESQNAALEAAVHWINHITERIEL
jgi:hypothetical protein